jgi:hypothetical protein
LPAEAPRSRAVVDEAQRIPLPDARVTRRCSSRLACTDKLQAPDVSIGAGMGNVVEFETAGRDRSDGRKPSEPAGLAE